MTRFESFLKSKHPEQYAQMNSHTSDHAMTEGHLVKLEFMAAVLKGTADHMFTTDDSFSRTRSMVSLPQ